MHRTKIFQERTDPLATEKAEIQKRALKRIHELENAIRNEFGFCIRSAVELEFFLFKKNKNEPLTHDDWSLLEEKHRPDSDTAIPDTPSFRSLSFVQRLIRERFFPEKYEVVLDSLVRSTDDQQTAEPVFRSARFMARASHYIKNLIQWKTQQLYPDADAAFVAFVPNTEATTAGIHVNISLWPLHRKFNAFIVPHLVSDCAQGTLVAQRELLATVIESPTSLHRLQNSILAPQRFSVDSIEKQKKMDGHSLLVRAENKLLTDNTMIIDLDSIRLENRLPGADADPTLAVLMSVAGLYHGLRHEQKIQQHNDAVPRIIPEGRLPLQKILAEFEQSDLAREMLGSELHYAVVSCRKQQYHTIGSIISK